MQAQHLSNELSQSLGGSLQHKLIAVYLERSAPLVVAALAVTLAGCVLEATLIVTDLIPRLGLTVICNGMHSAAYLPLSPGEPSDRLDQVLPPAQQLEHVTAAE